MSLYFLKKKNSFKVFIFVNWGFDRFSRVTRTFYSHVTVVWDAVEMADYK